MAGHAFVGGCRLRFRSVRIAGFSLMLAGVLLLSGDAAPLAAQSGSLGERLAIAPLVGVTLPAGKFTDYVDAGPGAGLKLAFQLRPGTALLLNGGYDQLRGAELPQRVVRAPDMRVMRFLAGVETELLPPEVRPLSFVLEAGVGATTFESDSFRPRSAASDLTFRQTAFTTAGGLQLGYDIGRGVTLFGDGKFNWSLVDKDRTRDLALLGPGYVRPFSHAVTVPIQVGVRARV